MKRFFTVMAMATILSISACAPNHAQASNADAGPAPTEAGPLIEVGTAISSSTSVPLSTINVPTASEAVGSNDAASFTGDVTLVDNGKSINLKVGDSFVLNLGSDFYDWTVDVDNQNVISREIGVTVTIGAQGIYLTHAPGIAKLTAVGNPQCLNSTPPCLAPSILFEITVNVQ